MTRYKILAPGSQYNAQHYHIAKMLGHVGSKWPVQGLMPRAVAADKVVSDSTGRVIGTELTNVSVWVTAAITRDDGRKSSTHRAMCRCPGCDRVMSVGRLFQHVCTGK